MFRNRSLRVKMVKDEPVEVASSIEYDKIVELIAKNAIIIIFAYIGADTVRQTLVHVAKTGIQPN
jgi:hypothetical protein